MPNLPPRVPGSSDFLSLQGVIGLIWCILDKVVACLSLNIILTTEFIYLKVLILCNCFLRITCTANVSDVHCYEFRRSNTSKQLFHFIFWTARFFFILFRHLKIVNRKIASLACHDHEDHQLHVLQVVFPYCYKCFFQWHSYGGLLSC